MKGSSKSRAEMSKGLQWDRPDTNSLAVGGAEWSAHTLYQYHVYAGSTALLHYRAEKDNVI